MITSTPTPINRTLDILEALLKNLTVTPTQSYSNSVLDTGNKTTYETWQLVLAAAILICGGLVLLGCCGVGKLISYVQEQDEEDRLSGIVRLDDGRRVRIAAITARTTGPTLV